MADYLKIFATEAEYNNYINGTYDAPNVSYIEETKEIKYKVASSEGDGGFKTYNLTDEIAEITGVANDGSYYTNEPYILGEVFNVQAYFKKFVVPEGVTSIQKVGIQLKCVEEVVLPSTCTSLGVQCFYGNSSMKKVNTENVKSFGSGCFHNCYCLEDVTISEGVTRLYENTFTECYGLTKIVLPSTIVSLNATSILPLVKKLVVKAVTPPTLYYYKNLTKVEEIYVPDESVATYKAATNWKTYASYIKPLSEYEE